MSKKSRHNAERRNRLAALRAELMLTLENEAKPHYMTYNARKTEQLIREFREFGAVPLWADNHVKYSYVNDPTRWETDYVDAMVHGQSITKMVLPST
jgi:hypothetical protein